MFAVSTLLTLALLVFTPGSLMAEGASSMSADTASCLTPKPDTETVNAERLPLASLATCTADCEDGSTVACSGSSCSAQDQNCANNQQGFCTGDSGQKSCTPACPDCDRDFVCNFSACTNDPDCENRCKPLWVCDTNDDCSQFGPFAFCNPNDSLCAC